jgi:hypothetical protein
LVGSLAGRHLVGELVDLDLGLGVLLGEEEQVVDVVLVQVGRPLGRLAGELEPVRLGHVKDLDPHARLARRVVGRDPEVARALLGRVARLLGGEHERLVDVLGHQLRALALLVHERDTDAQRRRQ